MITVGIDVGIENIKAVVLKDGKVLARAIGSSGGAGRAKAAEDLYNQVLTKAKLTPVQVDKVVATGQGKFDARFAASRVVEPVADVKAACFLSPSSRAVIDIGADQARAVQYDASGKITQYTLNHKCAAGIGLFLESASSMLGMSIEDMSKATAASRNGVKVNDQCAALAELDMVGLIHNNTPKNKIAQAVNNAMATKLSAMLNEMLDPIQKEVVLVGGVTNNAGLMQAFEKRLGIKCIIPDQPQYAGALGAALIAAG
jgi:predicted CoA-substrate-specific enzyme activase